MELFIILTRQAGEPSTSLYNILKPLGKVVIITDSRYDVHLNSISPEVVWIADECGAEFGGVLGREFPRVNSWARSLYWLSQTPIGDSSVWFVEDDVAGDVSSFLGLVAGTVTAGPDLAAIDLRTQAEDPTWCHWGTSSGYFEEPCRAFAPLCRLSASLLKEVLAFQQTNGFCVFFELMFASIARKHGMNWLDWNADPLLRKHLGQFHYRPAVSHVASGVSHPVKDPAIHKAICGLPFVAPIPS